MTGMTAEVSTWSAGALHARRDHWPPSEGPYTPGFTPDSQTASEPCHSELGKSFFRPIWNKDYI